MVGNHLAAIRRRSAEPMRGMAGFLVALQKRCKNEKDALVDALYRFDFLGSGGRDRTYDQLINSQLLYR
jgi:hypothetical protein